MSTACRNIIDPRQVVGGVGGGGAAVDTRQTENPKFAGWQSRKPWLTCMPMMTVSPVSHDLNQSAIRIEGAVSEIVCCRLYFNVGLPNEC